MVRWPDVFDPGNRILDRFVNISDSWLNRNICTYNHWDNHFYILGSGRKDLLPIPQYTEDNTSNVNVMCCPRCTSNVNVMCCPRSFPRVPPSMVNKEEGISS
jgi:hypothetical protein